MRLALLIILRISWTEKLGGGGDDKAVVLVSAAESTSGNILSPFSVAISPTLLLGLIPGEGKGYSLQYSGLENSMDCIVHGVAKNWTRLSDFHFTSIGEEDGWRLWGIRILVFHSYLVHSCFHSELPRN